MGGVLLADIEYAVIIALVLVLVYAFVRAQYALSDFEGRWTDGDGNMFVVERRGRRAGESPDGGSSWGRRLRILSAADIRPRPPGQPTITSRDADVKLFRRLCTAVDGKAVCARLSLDGRYLEWDAVGADGARRRWHKNGVL